MKRRFAGCSMTIERIAGAILCLLLAVAAIPGFAAEAGTTNGFVARASDHGRIVHFTDADFVLSAQSDIPARGWDRRTMPQIWLSDEARRLQPGRLGAWARMRFDRSNVDGDHLAILTENNREKLTVYFNGVDVYRNYRSEAAPAMGWNRPYLITVPNALVKTGVNEIILHTASRREFNLGVGSVWVGPRESLAALHADRYFWRIAGARGANYALIFLSAIIFVMWLWRRKEMELFWLAMTGFTWFVRDYHFFAEEAPFDPWLFQQITYYSLYPAIITSLCFCVEFMKPRGRRRIIGALLLLGLSLCLFRLFLVRSTATDVLSNLMTLGIVVAMLVVLFAAWLRQRTIEHLVLIGALGVSTAFALHDLGRVPNILWWDGLGFHAQPYTGLALFTAFLFSIGRRILRALDVVEQTNVELERRVEQATQALARSESARRRMEVERAIDSERERLMREMHDGIGSNLVTALAVARRREQHPDTIATLERAISDLKLTVDSLAPVDGDVVTLLANLRHRMEPDLRRAGIALDWQVEPCPPLEWLDAANALHMLRIIQEALSNVLTHANATRIVIRLRPSAKEQVSGILIEIIDDGNGFACTENTDGKGIANMRARARALGGECQFESPSTGGARVSLWLPERRMRDTSPPVR